MSVCLSVSRRPLARVMSGSALPQQGAVLPRGAGRPELSVGPVRRRLPVPPVVVRRVGGGARGRPSAHRGRQARLPPEPTLGSVLARSSGEGVRQVSYTFTFYSILF